ncbi:remodeling and spacing factor 1 isoform X2 [Kryptolebias marmoratus]|uniref:Remodeling and spacing factor 1 n=1 Tax=Kryptolebias marmoratus TaxID=37003 RepID=A0A3Q3B3K0_KRYMA|nr:remodeling and spacing factor 1 isoform X2 [Kryptolebias marmoratus]
MAAPAVVVVARSSGPPLCPSFAEVCSFLERYGPALDLPEMTFPQMERYLRDTAAVPKPLVDLHVKLLRKLGKSVTTDRWEKYLAKVCQELNSTWAWELEHKGYQEMSMECKSSILKYLCECQFDDNLKFKMLVNDEDSEKMRLQPIGRDQQGLLYWLQLDQEQNIRLYTEEQDDLDGSTWKCIVRTRNDLAEALELLKAQVEPNQSPDQNQAASRSDSPAEKETGENNFGVTNAKLPQTTEGQTDNKINLVKEEIPFMQVVKQEETLPVEQENTESAVKEENVDKKPSAFDNRVSTITAIKPEPRDADSPKNARPIVMATTVSLTKLSKVEEAEWAAVRSNQQAKIPLKKRDLKLADSFHSNHLNNSNSSSIIVCNPAAISSKDGKLLNSLGPLGSPAPLQQQVVVAPRQELTNGRASHLPHKEGQNGVTGVLGQVVGHIGVIRSPSEYHRAPGAGQQEQNGPSSEPCGPRAVDEDKEVGRQSVLVRKGPSERETTPAVAFLPPDVAMEDQTREEPQPSPLKTEGPPEDTETKVGSVGASSLSSVTKRKTDEDPDKITEEEESGASRQQKDEELEEAPERCVAEGVKGDPGKDSNISGQGDSELSGTVLSLKTDKWDKTDQQGVNGGLASRARLKGSGFGSEQNQGPLEEASSELQKEGIRLKIKIPPHRRNKLRKKGEKEEEKEREAQDEGRSLRRSARICRPSSKAAESQRKKPQKKQTTPARAREEEQAEGEEEEEEEGDDEEHGSPAAKERKAEPAGKFRKRRGKRRHGRPRWTNIRPKRRRPNEEGEAEDRGRKRGEEEEEEEEEGEGGSDSEEESCKSEQIPSEDACTHCGLPNHPELILLCDSCDKGYHTACLRPPLMLIPDGEWFCPPCQHKMLCEKLEEQLQNLDSALKKRERAERRRERLVYVGISVENIIPEGDEDEEEEKTAKPKDSKKSKNLGRRSTRTRKHISYRFDDFDDAIDEAIEEDIGDICGGAGTGKDITSVLSDDGKDGQRPIRSQTRLARNRKKRRLNDLESDSTAIESEDEFLLSNSSEDEEFGASGGDDDAEEEDEDAGSDVGSWDRGTRPKRGMRGAPKFKPKKTQRRGRRRGRRRSTEEEEEDSDIEMDSDQFSDMTDSDADKKRRGLRRGQRQQVNYRETSESSDNSRPSAERDKAKRRGRPRKERLSSDFSDVSKDSEEEDDYEDEDEDDQRRRVNKRRREEQEDLRGRRRREKQRGYEEDEGAEERRRRMKRRQLERRDDKRRRLSRTDREEEDLEKMGRGRRREILSEQRRRRLAQMLKKRRPSTDEEDEDESEDSDSSSEDGRPIRKRLNRIDSDDEEEEDEGQKTVSKKSSAVERRADRRNDSDAQERGRGQSPTPSNRLQASRGPEKPGTGSPAVPRDSAPSGRQERHNGPLREEEEYEEEEEESDSVNSVQSSPQS